MQELELTTPVLEKTPSFEIRQPMLPVSHVWLLATTLPQLYIQPTTHNSSPYTAPTFLSKVVSIVLYFCKTSSWWLVSVVPETHVSRFDMLYRALKLSLSWAIEGSVVDGVWVTGRMTFPIEFRHHVVTLAASTSANPLIGFTYQLAFVWDLSHPSTTDLCFQPRYWRFLAAFGKMETRNECFVKCDRNRGT